MGQQATGTARRRAKAIVGPEGIIETAEALFAERGINGVSLRQIAAASGLANNYSVQYHFGDRDGLVRAIFEHRLPDIDVERQRLLIAARKRGDASRPDVLLDCLGRPFLGLNHERDGRRSKFAHFLVQILQSSAQRHLRIDLDRLAPTTNEIARELRAQVPQVPDEIFDYRLLMATLLLLQTIGDPTLVTQNRSTFELTLEGAYAQALAIATACLIAPAPPAHE